MPSRRPAHTLDSMPVEAFLDGFSPAHREIAERDAKRDLERELSDVRRGR